MIVTVLLWYSPPAEIQLTAEVSTGESSKELEVQRNRTRREKETIYRTLQEVPPDPKEPWDIEMDYDDTLTPEIPIEQLPDSDATDDAPVDSQLPEVQNPDPSTSSQAEPDLELLAVLLKNPELVFALTSGQASGLSSEDTVRLLDLLKSSGGAGLLNGHAVGKPEDAKVEVSLPSPTPTRDVEVSLPSPTPPSRFDVSLPSPTPSVNPGPVRENVFMLRISFNGFWKIIIGKFWPGLHSTSESHFHLNELIHLCSFFELFKKFNQEINAIPFFCLKLGFWVFIFLSFYFCFLIVYNGDPTA